MLELRRVSKDGVNKSMVRSSCSVMAGFWTKEWEKIKYGARKERSFCVKR